MCWSCFSPDTMVVMADLSMRPISEIDVGDLVLGEHGTPERVTAVMSREYHGRITKLRLRGVPWTITATPEHKFHMSRFKSRNNDSSRIKFWEFPVREEVESQSIRTSDLAIMAKPMPGQSGQMVWPAYYKKKNGVIPKRLPPSELTPELATVLGLYIAEGCYSGRVVSFSFHSKETHLADLVEKEIGKLGIKTTRRVIGNKMDVRACSVSLGYALECMFGKGAENKHIPDFLINKDDATLQNVVKGIFLGDGHASPNGLTITTISERLASQLFMIGLRLGRPARVSTSPAAVRSGVNHSKFYQITFPVNPSKTCRSDFPGNQYRVRSVETETYHGLVYNITVEPSHRYFVAGALVNNCKAKGNLKHLHKAMGGGQEDWKDSLKALGIRFSSKAVHQKKVSNKRIELPDNFATYTTEDEVPAVISKRLRWSTILNFRLGSVGSIDGRDWRIKDRCIIPIVYKGEDVGWHARALKPEQQPRYYNPAGFDIKQHVFNYDSCAVGGEIILVEGAFNAMSAWEKGLPNTMAVFGTQFTSAQLSRILSLIPSRVVICFDRDPSKMVNGEERGKQGQKAAHKLGKLIHDAVPTYIMPLPVGKDPNDLSAEDLIRCYKKMVPYEKLFGED